MEEYLIQFWALIGLSILCGALGIVYAMLHVPSVYPLLSLLLMSVALIWMLANDMGRSSKT